MPASTREIKRRIKSVANIKKITKAMELVAASKMRRAVANVVASRSYANVAWQTVVRLSAKLGASHGASLHPLISNREKVKKAALVLITSNRGLCGGFNNQVLQKAVRYLKEINGQIPDVELVTLGKKGYQGLARFKYQVKADFEKKDVTTSITEIYALSHLLVKEYLANSYDQVVVAYTDYVSALTQKPKIFQILPLSLAFLDKDLGTVKAEEKENEPEEKLKFTKEEEGEYILEPDPKILLAAILPKMIEVRLYQAVLESDASEHSARMLAMRNATDSAGEMIDDLTLAYNSARQAGITKEISEISAGKASLED